MPETYTILFTNFTLIKKGLGNQEVIKYQFTGVKEKEKTKERQAKNKEKVKYKQWEAR